MRSLTRSVGMPSRCRRRGSIGTEWERCYLWVHPMRIELAVKRGRGYSAVAFESPRKGRVVLWDARNAGRREMRKKSPRTTAPGTQAHLAPVESTILSQHHSIVKHCCVTRYDDGDPRQPGWISIKTVGGVWQIEAKDPDTTQFLRVQQPHLDDAITLLALLLDSEDAPWEFDSWAAQQKNRKKR